MTRAIRNPRHTGRVAAPLHACGNVRARKRRERPFGSESRPCDALLPLIEARISSWYTVAKDPESPQVRFQTLATPDALSGLKNALEAVPCESPAAGSGMKRSARISFPRCSSRRRRRDQKCAKNSPRVIPSALHQISSSTMSRRRSPRSTLEIQDWVTRSCFASCTCVIERSSRACRRASENCL